MLIDFTVGNYRSIKEPVTLSTIAQKSKRALNAASRRGVKPDEEIAQSFVVEGRGFELLPVAGIFGANASGKSNVLRALEELTFLMVGSVFVPPIEVLRAFELDESYMDAPTKFELRIITNSTIFSYYLSADRMSVLHERLEYKPSGHNRTRCLFERTWNHETGKTTWNNGEDFKGPHIQLQQTLEEHEPYISLLIGRLKVKVIEPFANWIVNQKDAYFGIDSIVDKSIAARLSEQPERRDLVLAFLKKFDTGIEGLHIRYYQPIQNGNKFRIFSLHKTDAGREVQFDFEDESLGTQRLLPLAYKMLDAFDKGSTMLVDELGSNIHPNISHLIVSMFQNPVTNPKRAQLIFTSHDNTLQQGNLLRRDQIWFTQKRGDGSTDLYPLTDFHPRNDLVINKAYLDGRFGAVPFLPSDDELATLLEKA